MDDLISRYIDRTEFAADTKFAIEELQRLEAAYAKLRDTRVNLQAATGFKDIATNAGAATESITGLTTAISAQATTVGKAVTANKQQSASLQESIKNLNDYKAALASNAALQKQATKDVESGAITADQYRFKITALTEAQYKYKQAIADATKEVKSQIQLQFSAPTSKLEARTQNSILTRQVENTPSTDPARIKELNDLIDRNNALIDANSDKLTKQKINIGNYGPSVKAALSVLEEEIIKINTQLSNTDKNSKAFDVLTKQANLLKTVAAGLDKEFSTTKQELRALEEATKKVGTEFGITSDQFRKLAEEVGSRKDELKDIQSAVNFESSDTKNLDAIVGAVQAVTGAYGAYQAATVLLGDDNEELTKSMQKLQAVLTLVTSVQAVANALQKDQATVQGILAAKATLLAAAQKLVALTTGEAAAATGAQAGSATAATVAISNLAAAEGAAGAAGGEVAITSGAAATAMEAEAGAAVELQAGLTGVALGEAGVATGAATMATAIAATGIGLLIIGLAIAVYKIVDAIQDWSAANASVSKANELVSSTLKALIEETKTYDAINRLTTQRQLEDLDKLIEKRKALGTSQATSLALDKQAADARAKAAADEVATNKITLQSVLEKQEAERIAAGALREQQDVKKDYLEYVKNNKDSDFEATIKSLDKDIDLYQKYYDVKSADYQRDADLLKASEETKQQAEVVTLQASKLAADDRRKFILESARIQSDAQTAINNKTLNDDRSTLDERLKALKSNLAEQRKVILAENAAVQSDPTASGTDKVISAKKTANEIKIAESEGAQTIAKLKEDYRLKDLAASTEIEKKILEDISQTNEAIYKNDAVTEAQRLQALRNSISARRAILETSFNTELSGAGINDQDIERIKAEGYFEIKNKKITNKELEKLIADYNSAQVSLARDANTERIAIVKDYYEAEEDLRNKALRAIERESDLLAEDRTDTYNNDLIALNQSYRKGLVSTEKYNRDREKLEDELTQDLLKIELDKLQKSLAASVSANEIQKNLEKELADIKNFQGPQTINEQKIHDDRIKNLTAELEKVKEVAGKETELYKAVSDVEAKLSTSTVELVKKSENEKLAAIQKTLGTIKEVADTVFGLIDGLLNAQQIRTKNNLKEESDAAEKKAARDIEIANTSSATEEQKAARILVINARLAAQKDQIAQKEKQAEVERAKFAKAVAIFNIVLSTTQAVIKAYTEGDPYTKVARAILAGVAGAAQLAVAIATPIPKFRYGKNNDYEGPAIVDDGGVNEPIYRADSGQIEISEGSAKDRLTYLGKRDKVFSDIPAMMRNFAMPSITLAHPTSNDNSDKEMRMDIKKTNQLLEKIANKPVLHQTANEGGMVNMWKWGARQVEYVNDNTNW